MTIYSVLIFSGQVGVCLVEHFGKILAVIRNGYGDAQYVEDPIALVNACVELYIAYLLLLLEVNDCLEVGKAES